MERALKVYTIIFIIWAIVFVFWAVRQFSAYNKKKVYKNVR
jgi:hypothetical protein